ncbi:pyocin knob domain-containing protein [uncultured Gemmobacter sp.]|uniref:pyocin knob domain-containing protein n=1 Tax=uncultured Gemmobacter sp. TaxID=1095917 RepID=UPI002591F31D|nr:pyocin knob domain-containing protein [uncultured Gemmobacter sp.]
MPLRTVIGSVGPISLARAASIRCSRGNLSSLAGLTTSANKLAYYTGAGTAALATLSAFARTLLDDADQAAMRATLGLVPTGSATDTTAGRLVRTGDYGLGTAISLGATDNLDALLVSGFFYNPTAGNTAGNNYPPGISGAGALIVVARSSTNVIQKFISYGGTSTASGLREFTRSWGTSGWGPWVEQFHQGSLLGTVSQSGGVPTGKVIERGSNANGEYVRFADGTQICTAIAAGVDAATAAGPIYMRSNLLTWTFPASFLSAPVVAGGGGNAARWLGINAPSVGNVQYRVFSYASSGTLSMPGLIATGRWF